MKDKRSLLVLLVLVIVIALFFIMRPSGQPTQPQIPARQPIAPGAPISSGTVVIKDMKFNPPLITIKKGEYVNWKNDDGVSHTVSSGGFASRIIGAGTIYSHSFNSVGTFKYSCTIHPFMTGTVVVTE